MIACLIITNIQMYLILLLQSLMLIINIRSLSIHKLLDTPF